MSAIIQSQWKLTCDNHVGLIRQLFIKALQFPPLGARLRFIGASVRLCNCIRN